MPLHQAERITIWERRLRRQVNSVTGTNLQAYEEAFERVLRDLESAKK
ncbi:MAG TPA: hypothetical protein VFV38_21410 [Ktedonobacteraceae bacterium]|nr:hypothetical protein [Ktedonobacteraceae bacterium]